MAVSPETEWVLVACGLIAHADGSLDGNEAERLMSMVDDLVDGEDYADWLGLIGDKAALEARYAALADPPVDQHRDLLEQAWTMAMVDGERNAAELVVLARIAERLGVEPMQLNFWRDAWTRAEREFSQRVAQLAVYVLAGGHALFEDDHSPYLDLLQRLPSSSTEREALEALATQPPTDESALSRSLAAIAKRRRVQAFRIVAPLTGTAVEHDLARERFETVGRAAGLLDVAKLLA